MFAFQEPFSSYWVSYKDFITMSLCTLPQENFTDHISNDFSEILKLKMSPCGTTKIHIKNHGVHFLLGGG